MGMLLYLQVNGKARNNIGRWNVRSVPVPSYVKGFDFYKQKDVAMANEADYGFMIWDGESRGTLNNIINLTAQGKRVLVYLTSKEEMVVVKNFDDLSQLVARCVPTTRSMYTRLLTQS